MRYIHVGDLVRVTKPLDSYAPGERRDLHLQRHELGLVVDHEYAGKYRCLTREGLVWLFSGEIFPVYTHSVLRCPGVVT